MIIWNTEKRTLKELTPTSYNPRYLTDKDRKDLEVSLKKFNLAEIPVINIDNQIIAGHQRIKILTEQHGSNFEIDVRVPNRRLSDQELKEYLIRSNKNTGSWDWDELANSFETDELLDWGFTNDDLFGGDEIDEELTDLSDSIDEEFRVEVVCVNEREQEKAFNDIQKLGYECRLLTL